MTGAVVFDDGTAVTADIEGSVRMWADDGTLLATVDESSRVSKVVAGPGRSLFIGYGNGLIRKVDFASTDVQRYVPVEGSRWCVEVNRLGQRLSCIRPLKVDVVGADGRQEKVLDSGLSEDDSPSVSLSDRGAISVGAQRGTTFRLYLPDAASWIVVQSNAPVERAVLLNDRDWLVGLGDGKLQVWDQQGQLLRTIPGVSKTASWAIATHPTKPWVAVHDGEDPRTLLVIDVATGAIEARLSNGEQSSIALQFSQDGTLLIAGGDDGILRVWDVTAERLLRSLVGHRGNIRAVTSSASGQIVSIGEDGVIVWNGEDLATDVSPILSRRNVSALWSLLRSAASGDSYWVGNGKSLREWDNSTLPADHDDALTRWIRCAASSQSICTWTP
ncbi:MAG: hypothetical protein IPL79_11095 [Myxococcales bacterium]|nr:hypothetical protein [Myxococcales bacterium]